MISENNVLSMRDCYGEISVTRCGTCGELRTREIRSDVLLYDSGCACVQKCVLYAPAAPDASTETLGKAIDLMAALKSSLAAHAATDFWTCLARRSHGVCNTKNSAENATCWACGDDRPAATGAEQTP